MISKEGEQSYISPRDPRAGNIRTVCEELEGATSAQQALHSMPRIHDVPGTMIDYQTDVVHISNPHLGTKKHIRSLIEANPSLKVLHVPPGQRAIMEGGISTMINEINEERKNRNLPVVEICFGRVMESKAFDEPQQTTQFTTERILFEQYTENPDNIAKLTPQQLAYYHIAEKYYHPPAGHKTSTYQLAKDMGITVPAFEYKLKRFKKDILKLPIGEKDSEKVKIRRIARKQKKQNILRSGYQLNEQKRPPESMPITLYPKWREVASLYASDPDVLGFLAREYGENHRTVVTGFFGLDLSETRLTGKQIASQLGITEKQIERIISVSMSYFRELAGIIREGFRSPSYLPRSEWHKYRKAHEIIRERNEQDHILERLQNEHPDWYQVFADLYLANTGTSGKPYDDLARRCNSGSRNIYSRMQNAREFLEKEIPHTNFEEKKPPVTLKSNLWQDWITIQNHIESGSDHLMRLAQINPAMHTVLTTRLQLVPEQTAKDRYEDIVIAKGKVSKQYIFDLYNRGMDFFNLQVPAVNEEKPPLTLHPERWEMWKNLKEMPERINTLPHLLRQTLTDYYQLDPATARHFTQDSLTSYYRISRSTLEERLKTALSLLGLKG